jgi:hypothetical protein
VLTQLTASIEFWIFAATALIGVGAYKLITKQNTEQIKGLGEKLDSMRIEVKVDQATMKGNFDRLDDAIMRIEKDTAITKEKSSELSQAIARIQVKLENIENGGYKHEHF